MRNLYAIDQNSDSMLKVIVEKLITIEQNQKDQKKDLSYVMQFLRQGTEVSDFYPLDSNEQIDIILDKSDPEFEPRRHGLIELLKTSVSKETDPKKFAHILRKAIFYRKYTAEHKFPPFG